MIEKLQIKESLRNHHKLQGEILIADKINEIIEAVNEMEAAKCKICGDIRHHVHTSHTHST